MYTAGRARNAAGVHYLHACPPHAFFARERLLRAAARLGRGRRRGLEAACALRGDYDTGFCALSAVLRVCDGAGAKAAAPMARAAIIAVFILRIAASSGSSLTKANLPHTDQTGHAAPRALGYPRVKIRCPQRPYFPRKHPPRDASYSSHQPRAPDGRKSDLYSSTVYISKRTRISINPSKHPGRGTIGEQKIAKTNRGLDERNYHRLNLSPPLAHGTSSRIPQIQREVVLVPQRPRPVEAQREAPQDLRHARDGLRQT